MEEKVEINTDDNHIIYGILNSMENTNGNIIIFCHGLSGNINEHHYFNAVAFFNKRKYTTFRFNFYARAPKARQFSECSISIHAQDINTVLDYFKNKYKNIFLVGHSLWALAIMNAQTDIVKKIIYWDPSCGPKKIEDKNITYNKKTWLYTLHWGLEFIANQDMINEWMESNNLAKYSKRLKWNCGFIFAGNNSYYKAWEPYIKNYNIKVVKWASHVFTEEGTEKKLFEKTLELLE